MAVSEFIKTWDITLFCTLDPNGQKPGDYLDITQDSGNLVSLQWQDSSRHDIDPPETGNYVPGRNIIVVHEGAGELKIQISLAVKDGTAFIYAADIRGDPEEAGVWGGQ